MTEIQEYFNSMFSYNPETGDLTWKERTDKSMSSNIFNGRFVGKIAGSKVTSKHSKTTYLQVKIQKAFIVMSITRSIEDIEDNIATISILKNRSGKSGKIISNVYFNNGTCEIDTEKSIIMENSEDVS